MARKLILENLMRLAKSIGANHNKFMGTRGNITFLGKGPTTNPLFQSPLAGLETATKEQLGSRGTMIEAVEDAMGFASAGKLNDIQLKALTLNLEGINKIYNPPVLPMASITDIAPGIGGLKGRGFASLKDEMADQLRKGGRQLSDVAEADIDKLGYVRGGLEKFPKESHKFFGRPLKDQDFAAIDKLVQEGKLKGVKVPEGVNPRDTILPEALFPGSSSIQAGQRTSARAAMIKLLDMTARGEKGVGVTLRELLSKQELKFLLEGGGGTKGDPLVLFNKYFGVDVAKHLPLDASPQTINAFTKKLMRMKDRGGNWFDEASFNPEEPVFAEGGLADILQVRSGMRIGGLGLLTRGLRAALKRTTKGYDKSHADYWDLMDNPSYLLSPVNMQKIKKLEIYRKQLVRDILRNEGRVGKKYNPEMHSLLKIDSNNPKPVATRADLQLLDDYIAQLKNKIKEVGYYGQGAAAEKALVQERNALSNELPFSKFVRDKFLHADGGRAGYAQAGSVGPQRVFPPGTGTKMPLIDPYDEFFLYQNKLMRKKKGLAKILEV